MPTALLIHSGGFTSRQWRKLGDALAPRWSILAPDLIGYGAEPRWPDGKPFHFVADVDRLEAMVAAIPDDELALVGHSYGGFLALQLALRRGVRSIAVYEPVAFGILDDGGGDAFATYDPARAEAWLAGFVEWWNGLGAWAALAESTRQAFRDVGYKLSEEVRSLAADRTGARYAQVTAPTLVLGGTTSPLAEQRVLDALAATLPRVRLVRFPDVGHMAPITHAAQVNAEIVAHLDAH